MILYSARYVVPIGAPSIEDGALLVRDGRIAAVGRRSDLAAAHPRAEVVDFGETVLLPPLVNAHTHLELTRFPDWAQRMGEGGAPATFVDWILRVIRVKRAAAPEGYRPSLEEGIRASLAAGTGAVGDILSYFPARKAYGKSPLLGRVFLETLGRDPLQGRKVLQSIGAILDEGPIGPLQPGLSPHSPYTLSSEYLEQVLDFCRRRKVPASIHLGESSEEVAFLEVSGGPLADTLYPYVGWGGMVPPAARRTPTAYLADRGGLVPWNLLVHGVQVGSEDAERIARSGASVVLCPRSNARLGVGRAPLALYRAAGVPLALGTDSLASCDSLSVWDEIAFARHWFEGEVGDDELLAMATCGGARALRLEGEMGSLQGGLGAHFQVLRPQSLPPVGDLETFLCSPGRTGEVAHLYLHGRDVLQNP